MDGKSKIIEIEDLFEGTLNSSSIHLPEGVAVSMNRVKDAVLELSLDRRVGIMCSLSLLPRKEE